ncbi:MAG: HEPN domain-containing protein [Sulfurovum sp. FS08-3]|nr:MAG: HEPN domain-containing protein [Sulfurovum sp. FS08-3]
MKMISKEWLKASNDDMLIIEQIINIEHLTHMVAFHSQQAIEKSLKALIEEYEIDIPKIHKLIRLKKILSDKLTIENDELLETLDELYIDSRYPSNMGLLPNGKPTLEEAKEFYEFAQNIFDKVCNQLNITKSEITDEK